jgi:hypothetical protein
MTWLITVDALELPPPLLAETTPLVYLYHALLLLDPRLWGSALGLRRRRPLFLGLRLRNMRDHIPWHQMHTRTYVYSCTVVSLGCILAILSGELLLRCYLAQISLPI